VSSRCGSSFPCSRVGTLFLHALRERIADRQHGELPACGGCSASQTGVPTRSMGTRMAKAYCPAVVRVFATVARDGDPFLAIVFAHMTRGIGSESPNCAVDRVLKSPKNVGYYFCVNTRGVEIQRTSHVQASLEQKPTKDASRDLSGESVIMSHGFSFFLTASEHPETAQSQSAVGLVQDVSVTAWARARDVRQPTV
jgi:hypothetical protein